jgi:hypothetical protein
VRIINADLTGGASNVELATGEFVTEAANEDEDNEVPTASEAQTV